MSTISTPTDLKHEFEALISSKSFSQAVSLLEEQYLLHKDQLGLHHVHTIELVLMIADVFLLIPNYARALERFIEAKNLAQAALGNDHILLSQSYYGMARVYQMQKLNEEACSFYQKALQVIQDKPNLALYVECCRQLGETALLNGDHASAATYFQQALNCQSLPDDVRASLELRAQMLRISSNEAQADDTGSTIDYSLLFEVVEKVPLCQQDASLLSQAYRLLALESADAAEYGSMQRFYLKYLQAEKLLGNFQAFHTVKLEVLETIDSLRAPEQAVQFIEQLNNICKDWPVAKKLLVENALELAQRLVSLEQLERAQQVLLEGQDLLHEMDEPLLHASVIHDLGCIFFLIGDIEQAKQLIINAQEIRRAHLSADDESLLKSAQALTLIENSLSGNNSIQDTADDPLDASQQSPSAVENESYGEKKTIPICAEANVMYAQAMELLNQNKPYEALEVLNLLLSDLQTKFVAQDQNLLVVMRQIAAIYKQIGFSHQAQQILRQIESLST